MERVFKAITSIRASLGSADRQAQRLQVYVDFITWMNAADGNHPDIALFRLAQNVNLSSTVNVVRLPAIQMEHFAYENKEFNAIGWGQVSSGVFSRYLQYTNFKILPKSSCNLGQYLMCSQPPTGTSQLLGGDSGGPGVILEIDGIETLVGVNVAYVTSGTKIWQASTRVSSFLRWIQEQTGIVVNPDSLMSTPKGHDCLIIGVAQILKSKNHCYNLIYQLNGNVATYRFYPNNAVWSTGTAGTSPTAFCMRQDGNLVLEKGTGTLWSSGTQGNPGAYAILRNDGKLAIYKRGTSPDTNATPLWVSNNFATATC